MISSGGQMGSLYTVQQQHALARGVAQTSQQCPQPLPILPHLDGLIKTLADVGQRDDLKLKALQEVSNSFEELANTPAYQPLLENLLRSFLKLFQDTVPQFIGENNTQQLRKLMLEMILRMSCNDIVKQFAKAIQAQLTKIIQAENEENALIAIKIMAEHQRGFRLPFSSEITTIINHFKSIYREMPQHITNGRMFEQRDQIRHCGSVNPMEDSVIESSLQFCYTPTLVFLPDSAIESSSQRNTGYSLIPRGSQSVKVLSEVPMFIVVLFQVHRHHLQNEMMDFVPLIVQYVNLSIPNEQRNSQLFNTSLAEEFYNSQVRALTFLGYIARNSVFNMADVMNSHSASLVQGIVQLMERCPHDVLSMRRELIGTTKNFFQCEMRTKFIPILPRLFNEGLLMGTGFTVNDHMRQIVYSMLADLVHHLRVHLSYNLLCCSVYTFSKSIHDQSLPPYVQAMCCKLIMNLIDSFIATEKNHTEQPCRDMLFWTMENYVRKFKVIAQYHVPLLFEKNAGSIIGGRLRIDEKAQSDQALKSGSGEKKEAKSDESDISVVEEGSSQGTVATTEDVDGGSTSSAYPPLPSPTKTGKFETSKEILTQYWVQTTPPMSVADAKSMVRVLVQACKHIVHGLKDTHITNLSMSPIREVEIMERLLRYGLRCLDVFMIAPLPPSQISPAMQRTNGVRSKDEKESLDLFASIYTLLNPSVFKEIFSKYIDFFIERIAQNYALQVICNAFLVHPSTSAKFGNILVRYLMNKLPQMAANTERAALYLKLFKLVFSSVSCSQSTGCIENERMLRPYLHDMVHQSMELALRGREPINYFLLLRALFRSIGGGSYDLLYQTFLPLLPTLLQQLNRLQSGAHRTQMRELFVELCLTVPVRLSSLLPYLPLLMDPLVCALNGSPTLVHQGLRTLELCVDNLQPEYLYEHMAPVRAQLMHGLWKSVSNPDKTAPLIAFRILGKFGGSNRKMLSDPQVLTFNSAPSAEYPSLKLVFQRSLPTAIGPDEAHFIDEGGTPLVCELSICEVVHAALEHLRSPFQVDSTFLAVTSSSMPSSPQPSPLHIRRHSFVLVRSVILSALAPTRPAILKNPALKQHLLAQLEVVKADMRYYPERVFRCKDEGARTLFLDCLTALFFAVVARDQRNEVLSFFNAVVRQLTIQSIFEQCGKGRELVYDSSDQCMDGTILVDAIMNAFADPCKDICHAAIVALTYMKDTSIALYGDIETAARAPLFRYVLERVSTLCYREAWYARLGGCTALKFVLEDYPRWLIVDNIRSIIAALFEVIIGLSDEVSSSAIDMSIEAIDKLLKVCFGNSTPEQHEPELVSIFMEYAVNHLSTTSSILRDQCRILIAQIAELTSSPIIDLLSVQKGNLESILRCGTQDFRRMSLSNQIAFMEMFTYIYMQNPPLFTFSLSEPRESQFSNELIAICSAEDTELLERPNYQPSRAAAAVLSARNQTRIVALRQAAIKAVVACYVASYVAYDQSEPMDTSSRDAEETEKGVATSGTATCAEGDTEGSSPEHRAGASTEHDRLFVTALKCLTNGNQKIQDTAFTAIKESISRVPLKPHLLQTEMRPMLMTLHEYSTRALNKNILARLLHLIRISPNAFNTKFADQLLMHLTKWPDPVHASTSTDEMHAGEIVLEMLSELPTADARFVEVVIPLVAKWEAAIALDSDVNWRYPLLQFLLKFPRETIGFFVLSESITNEGIRILFKYATKHEEANCLREVLMNDSAYFLRLLHGEARNRDDTWTKCCMTICDMEFLALKLIANVGKRHPEWAAKGARDVVKVIQSLWNDKDFRSRYTCKDYMEEPRYEVPKLAALIMLRYFKENINDNDILFDLCHVFTNHFISDFTFVRTFIEDEVIPKYPIEWRQNALKRVVKMFEEDPATAHDDNVVKILQYVVIPSLHFVFERYNVDVVVGTPANPDVVDDNNLISLVCQKILDRTKFEMSDAMLIQLFHLGCLFVSNCPTHIHDFTQKKQGNRLRILMLLGWPCLSATPQDQTMKYMGHLLICHIINQFNINRKIVLQVFHSLLKAYHTDPREVVKKSLDILTPAVPIRMDDGHRQMMSFVKKTIIDEGHNMQQLFHCMSMVVRHYKIYYHVRHQMIQFIMNGVQRLVMAQGSIDNRRLAIDVCEMVIKWEQWRLKQVQEASEAATQQAEAVQGTPAKGASPDSNSNSSSSCTQLQTSTSSFVKQMQDEDLHNPIDKTFVDSVVNLLLKMATSVPETSLTQNASQQALALEQLNKRSLGLLRACLKPNVWGKRATIKMLWLDKQLSASVESTSQQYREQAPTAHQLMQAQTTLDVLTQLVVILPPEVVVHNVKVAQRGIISCLNCQQNPVMRSLYQLIAKLFEKTKSSPEGLDELETINQFVAKFINDTFTNYERAATQPVQGIFGTIHLLRTICSIQPAYVDTVCLQTFMRALQKLVKDHITVSSLGENKGHAVAELIIYSLELLRPRMRDLHSETRRTISQYVLQPLIDKTMVDRILDVVIKVVDEMVTSGDEKQPNQGVPLLIRLMQTFEAQRRHEKGGEMLLALLGIVLYVYETPHLRTTETAAKLSTAFHWGLSVSDEGLRKRFFKVFDAQVPRKVYERLYHIVALQNWSDMHQSFWIKHCITLMFSSIMEETKDWKTILAWRTELKNCATFWRTFEISFQLEELEDRNPLIEEGEELFEWDVEIAEQQEDVEMTDTESSTQSAQSEASRLDSLIDKQNQLLTSAARFHITHLLPSFTELVHYDTELASKVWIKLFPSLWSGLTHLERASLETEMMPFLVSASHLPQKECIYSAVSTFLEAVCQCRPGIRFQSNVLKYMSSTHRAWHRGLMLLEREALTVPRLVSSPAFLELRAPQLVSEQLAVLDSLSEMYSDLAEWDQHETIWQRRAYFEQTSKAISLMNQGDYVKAVEYLESLMDSVIERLTNLKPGDTLTSITPALYMETREWEKNWVKIMRELNAWDAIRDYANSQSVQDLDVLADASWHIPDWALMKECVAQISGSTAPASYFKAQLYKAMLMVTQPEPDESTEVLYNRISKTLEAASEQLIKEWKRLPSIVSQSHVHILQAAHQVQEVLEASAISSHLGGTLQGSVINDVKSIIKTWRNRSPTLADAFSHWVDIHQWRLHHYASAVGMLQNWDTAQPGQLQQSLLPIHSAAQSQIQMARAARKNGLVNVALDMLTRMHTMPTLPAMDAHAKVYENLKCLLKVSMSKELTAQDKQDVLLEALHMVEDTSVSALTKDQVSKLFTMKGTLLSKLEQREEANAAFSAAAAMHESLTMGSAVWSQWGEHLENVFYSDRSEGSAMLTGLNALVCLLEAARVENELKARKHFARLFWLMKVMATCGSEVQNKMDEMLEKYGVGIPALNWLQWLPQLITELKARPSRALARIIRYVGETHEQQTFCAIREVLPSHIVDERVRQALESDSTSTQNQGCTFEDMLLEIVAQLCRHRPPDITALNRMFIELDSINEGWVERNLRIGTRIRNRLLQVAFENRNDVTSVIVSKELEAEIIEWTRSLSDFSNLTEPYDEQFIKKTAQMMAHHLDLSTLANSRVMRILSHLNSSIAVLEAKFDMMPKEGMLRDLSPFLASFGSKMANVEAFGDAAALKVKDYSAFICRFMPVYHIVRRGDAISRRFSIRSLNGKVHCFYLKKCPERRRTGVNQLFSMINYLLTKERETCRRLLQFAIARVLPLGTSLFVQCPNAPNALPTLFDILNDVLHLAAHSRKPIDLVTKYYDRIVDARGRVTNKLLSDIMVEMNGPDILPHDSLSKWLLARYDDATHYYTLRKQVALHLSLFSVCEYIFQLTTLNLESTNLNMNTGQLSNTELDFNIHLKTLVLEPNRAVPFRLSCNLQNFLGLSVEGHFKCSMLATARCLQQRSVLQYARPILWDAYFQRTGASEANAAEIIAHVSRAVESIQNRLNGISNGDSSSEELLYLTEAARSLENLSRTDPSWYPWF
uniref:FAT domain-containing protein n=2 Tax=Parascaris univalens TaxID=6257 RepID=A0A915BXE0_PARUN